jgi:pimeloyl-ACP methyl ester carboxylesterase
MSTIDGQSIHYVDEGQGVPIVLIHGSFGSLRAWNPWADVLKTKYRVIRFDLPAMGLSGPDPEGRYDTVRAVELIRKLTAKLGVGRFLLAATSSGGEVAAAYAALNPGDVRGVILSNIAAGPIKHRPTQYPLSFWLTLWADSYLGGYHTTAFWGHILRMNYADSAKVTTGLVQEWTDLNNRAQFFPRAAQPIGYIPFARTPADLAAIHAPTLLLWSDSDHEVPVAVDGRNALRLVGSTDKQLTVIANCGHMMPLECGPQSVVAVKAFADRLVQ